MKAQLTILFLLIGLLSVQAHAGNGNNDPQQEEKKTIKPKYDFNIFKFFSVPVQQQLPDSLKRPSSKSRTIFLTDRHSAYTIRKKS
jgi:hypothetical protein